MKVLQINHVYKNGGSTGRIVYDLKNILLDKGFDPYVAFGYEYKKTNDEHTYKIESIPELKVNILKTRLFAKHAFYNTWQTKRLLKWIDNLKPDIIHLHNIHGHYINVAMLFDYIKKHKTPVVWTLHDCWSFTGWCAYFDYSNCDKWCTECKKCPSRRDYPYSWFFDRSKSNFKRKRECFCGVENLTIVTPSKWLAELTSHSFLSEYPIEVINNGIDLNVFSPQETDFKKRYKINDRKMILAVSMGFEKRKGIDYIFELAKRIDNSKEVLVLLGVEKNKINKVPQNIICIAKTSDVNLLTQAYSAADVFINPTLEDNFPTTNLESLACGTPVITFRTGGSPESIFEGCGEVVEKYNMEEFTKAVYKVLGEGKNSQLCVDVANRLYDKKKCFDKYISLYERIYEGKGKA